MDDRIHRRLSEESQRDFLGPDLSSAEVRRALINSPYNTIFKQVVMSNIQYAELKKEMLEQMASLTQQRSLLKKLVAKVATIISQKKSAKSARRTSDSLADREKEEQIAALNKQIEQLTTQIDDIIAQYDDMVKSFETINKFVLAYEAIEANYEKSLDNAMKEAIAADPTMVEEFNRDVSTSLSEVSNLDDNVKAFLGKKDELLKIAMEVKLDAEADDATNDFALFREITSRAVGQEDFILPSLVKQLSREIKPKKPAQDQEIKVESIAHTGDHIPDAPPIKPLLDGNKAQPVQDPKDKASVPEPAPNAQENKEPVAAQKEQKKLASAERVDFVKRELKRFKSGAIFKNLARSMIRLNQNHHHRVASQQAEAEAKKEILGREMVGALLGVDMNNPDEVKKAEPSKAALKNGILSPFLGAAAGASIAAGALQMASAMVTGGVSMGRVADTLAAGLVGLRDSCQKLMTKVNETKDQLLQQQAVLEQNIQQLHAEPASPSEQQEVKQNKDNQLKPQQ